MKTLRQVLERENLVKALTEPMTGELVTAYLNRNKITGIELRFGKTLKLKILSYAVIVNGVCHVDHATTLASRLAGNDLMAHVKIEQARNPKLKIL